METELLVAEPSPGIPNISPTDNFLAEVTAVNSGGSAGGDDTHATPQAKRPGVPAAGVLAAAAVLCCAAIHFAAVKGHREIPKEAWLFGFAAVGQTVIGLLALVRWNKFIRALIVVSSLMITGGWLLSRTRGLPVFGTEEVGLGDATSAGLQIVAAALAGFVPALTKPRKDPIRAIAGAAALAVGAGFVAVPPTLKHGNEDASFAGSISAVWGAHEHIHTAQAAAGLTGNGVVQSQPTACHPTATQVRDADLLVAKTQMALQKYADPQTAIDEGFQPLGFEPNGVYHYLNRENMATEEALNPNKPESIVYGRQPDGSIHPIGVMFMVSEVGVHGPKPGGCLMTWHSHGWPFAQPGEQSVEMVHVWTVPVPGGPFAHESGPDYARIYLNKPPVGPDEINLLLEDAFKRYKTKTMDPKMISALGILAVANEKTRCGPTGKTAMTTLNVSAALQSQICDPLLNDPVPGADSGGLFASLGRGVLNRS
jgi:hypothetical protein